MKTLTVLLPLLLLSAPAAAQGYQPDIIELDASEPLGYDPDPAFTIADGGTIEMWVQPDWTDDPGYDPVILSNIGPQGASYMIALTSDRQALLVGSGAREEIFAFDFSDGRMHHIAVNQFTDGLTVLIDGQAVGESDMVMLDLPSEGLWLGSIEGTENIFIGAVAGLRIWDYVPDLRTLITYAQRDVLLAEHPRLDMLSAMSDFAKGELLVLQEIDE